MEISRKFERNLGFMTSDEQALLHDSKVVIAGAGGDGGLLAVEMARLGVQNFCLADPDPFEEENTNRQATCVQGTLGKNKAEAVGNYLQAINPDINTEIFDEGIQKSNVADFVEGADLVIDETEFTMPELGVMLARESRANNVPQMTALNIGFGAIVTTYHPKGPTLEKQLGFTEDQDIDEIAQSSVSLDRWLPYLPAYGDVNVLKKVADGDKSAPSIAPGVALAAGVGATQALLNLLKGQNNRPDPVYAPKAITVDAMEQRFKQTKISRVKYYQHLSRLLLRNVLGKNPKADY